MLIEERFFRQISAEAATGFWPHQYVVQRRVERARVPGVSPGALRREDTRRRAIALSRP